MRFTAKPVVGTRSRHWQIVNELGGLVRYFEGSRRQAEKEAQTIELDESFKRVAQLEAALRHVARCSSGYTRESAMGGIHTCANDVLIRAVTMVAVRVKRGEGLERHDYSTVYSSCPPQFYELAHAQDWAMKLDCSQSWPNGQNPGYHVVEIDSGDGVDVLNGHPRKMSLST
jgi:hypothetical protein